MSISPQWHAASSSLLLVSLLVSFIFLSLLALSLCRVCALSMCHWRIRAPREQRERPSLSFAWNSTHVVLSLLSLSSLLFLTLAPIRGCTRTSTRACVHVCVCGFSVCTWVLCLCVVWLSIRTEKKKQLQVPHLSIFFTYQPHGGSLPVSLVLPSFLFSSFFLCFSPCSPLIYHRLLAWQPLNLVSSSL